MQVGTNDFRMSHKNSNLFYIQETTVHTMSEVVHKVVDGVKHAAEVVGDGAKKVADVTIVS